MSYMLLVNKASLGGEIQHQRPQSICISNREPTEILEHPRSDRCHPGCPTSKQFDFLDHEAHLFDLLFINGIVYMALCAFLSLIYFNKLMSNYSPSSFLGPDLHASVFISVVLGVVVAWVIELTIVILGVQVRSNGVCNSQEV